MAQLTLPILSAGLVVDVLVNLDAAVLLPQRSLGGGPSPISGKGLIDTGSDITAVTPSILQQLGIAPLRAASTQGIGGPVQVNLYQVSIHILDVANIYFPWFSHPSLLVMELPLGFPHDVLIGLDVVRTCKLLVDGPAQQFTLEY